MADPYEIWRLAWAKAVLRGFQSFASFLPGGPAAREDASPEASDLPVFGPVRLDLPTMRLLEQRRLPDSRATKTLIVAPFAIHEASIADFAERHSLARALADGRRRVLALTYWKSATAAMRDYGLDAYLGDLNVAVDDLGGRVSLVGLCQGGWLAAAYAARFPAKVVKLALAGAPIDLGAADSGVTRALAAVPPAMIASLVTLGGGLVSGALSLALSTDDLTPEFSAEAALQCSGDPRMTERIQCVEPAHGRPSGRLFRPDHGVDFRGEPAGEGLFCRARPKGRSSSITAAIFVLAAADDEVVALAQATAVESLCPQARVRTRVEPGRHLSLFMGRKTVGGAWPEVGRWLSEPEPRPAAAASRRRKRGSSKGSRPLLPLSGAF